MSGTAWLVSRLAGYLGGWQLLLDSGFVCVCVASLCTHARPLHMTSDVCPPFHSPLAQKKSNQGDNLLPLLKKSFQNRKGSSPQSEAHSGALCLSAPLNHLASLL